MRTVDTYIAAALELQGIPSDRQLAVRLGLSQQTVNHWRTKRTWPSDETMVKLAELAQMDIAQALLDLNQWRSQSTATRNAYARIAALLTGTAAAVLLFCSGVMINKDVQSLNIVRANNNIQTQIVAPLTEKGRNAQYSYPN